MGTHGVLCKVRGGYRPNRQQMSLSPVYPRIAGLLVARMSTQPRQYGDVSLEGPCWQTSATAMDHFQVSRPTLKAMRERGEVEFIKPGRSYRYNICL